MSDAGEAHHNKVLVADDDPIVRGALAAIIERAPDMELVAAVGTGTEAVAVLRSGMRVDVALMDVRMPGQNGIRATREIRTVSPDTKVVLLTSLDYPEMLRDALTAQASGLILKSDGTQAILGAVRAARHGTIVLSREPINRTQELKRKTAPTSLRLSAREREVLELLCRANSNAEIAHQLNISESRVKAHVSMLIDRFQVDSRLKVVVRAFEWGLAPRP